MKKYTVNEMLEMDDCKEIKCEQCPFSSNKNGIIICDADIYRRKNNNVHNVGLLWKKMKSIKNVTLKS